MRNIVFIGGVFHCEIEKYVLQNSSGVIQNAADAFQKNILIGLEQQCNAKVVILNFPFVGSYPKRFKKFWFKSFKSFGRDNVSSYGFLNLSGFKLFSRFISVVKAIFENRPTGESCIIIYSVHLPFLAAVTLYKKIIRNNVKVILIVPDLPEYMSSCDGALIRVLKFIQSKILNYCYKSVDGYVLLTKYMLEHIPVKVEQYVVVEGVSNGTLVDEITTNNLNPSMKSIFYSGTLDSRYGIRELIEAVENLSIEVELLICGEGDSKEYILDASKRTSRIRYLGQLPRSEVLKIQKSCTLLINPRSDAGQFTKYSFPSKVIEYMCSGRPVLMYSLPGIPSEYYEYCFRISGDGVAGIMESLENVLLMDAEILNDVGARAKSFVLNEKSGFKQSQKIFNLIERLK